MLNVDSAVSGPELELSGVPSLRDLVLDAAGAITDVRTGQDAPRRLDRTHGARPGPASRPAGPRRPALGQPVTDSRIESQPTAPRRSSPRWTPLGSGSDYTAFVDHLGVPAVDVGFNGGYGVYHSIYDNFNWMEKFGDPEFFTHATAARLYTVIAMRAAAAEVVPLKFVPYGVALREHVDELRRIHAAAGAEGRARPSRTPSAEFAGLAGLVKAVRAFQPRPSQLDRGDRERSRHGREWPIATSLATLNDALARSSGRSCSPTGCPAVPGSSTRSTPPA